MKPNGLMNQQEIIALQKIIEYLAEEKEDYKAQGKPVNHIYEHVSVIEKWLNINPACSGLIVKRKKTGKRYGDIAK